MEDKDYQKFADAFVDRLKQEAHNQEIRECARAENATKRSAISATKALYYRDLDSNTPDSKRRLSSREAILDERSKLERMKGQQSEKESKTLLGFIRNVLFIISMVSLAVFIIMGAYLLLNFFTIESKIFLYIPLSGLGICIVTIISWALLSIPIEELFKEEYQAIHAQEDVIRSKESSLEFDIKYTIGIFYYDYTHYSSNQNKESVYITYYLDPEKKDS